MEEKTAMSGGNNNTPLNKDKILFVITKSNFGGAQRYVFELAVRLHQDGFETAVALGGSGILKTKLEAAGIAVFPIESAERDISFTKEVKVLWRLFRIMRAYRPTVVHLNSPKIGGLGAVAARLCGVKKIVYTNHGWPFNEARPEWQLVVIRILSWCTVFLGGTTIVLGNTEHEQVSGWPFIGKKLAIVQNGVVPFEVKARTEALSRLVGVERAKKLLEEKWKVLGTISELHKNKGLEYALEGLRLYIEHIERDIHVEPRVIYIIMGEGERRAEIEGLIKEKKLEKYVVLAGHVDEAREYISAFDIFVFSSIKEGLPFALLEAGYVGVPVISTSVGGIPEVIENLVSGLLIPPRRPSEIKNALIYLDEHPDMKISMVEAFKKKINTTYNFNTIVEKIKAIYAK